MHHECLQSRILCNVVAASVSLNLSLSDMVSHSLTLFFYVSGWMDVFKPSFVHSHEMTGLKIYTRQLYCFSFHPLSVCFSFLSTSFSLSPPLLSLSINLFLSSYLFVSFYHSTFLRLLHSKITIDNSMSKQIINNFSSLMAYQPSCVIQCKGGLWRKPLVVLFNLWKI